MAIEGVRFLDLCGYLAMLSVELFRGKLLLGVRKKGWLFLGKDTKIIFRSNIYFGKAVRIGENVTLSGLGKRLNLGDSVSIGSYSKVIVSTNFKNVTGYIEIGNNVGIGEFSYIGGAGGVTIGDNTIVGQYLSIHPQNHSFPREGHLVRLMPTFEKGITIGSNCWLGSKVTFLDGASVGNNCVVAAGAVVTGQFPSNTLIGGVPAKVIRHL